MPTEMLQWIRKNVFIDSLKSFYGADIYFICCPRLYAITASNEISPANNVNDEKKFEETLSLCECFDTSVGDCTSKDALANKTVHKFGTCIITHSNHQHTNNIIPVLQLSTEHERQLKTVKPIDAMVAIYNGEQIPVPQFKFTKNIIFKFITCGFNW